MCVCVWLIPLSLSLMFVWPNFNVSPKVYLFYCLILLKKNCCCLSVSSLSIIIYARKKKVYRTWSMLFMSVFRLYYSQSVSQSVSQSSWGFWLLLANQSGRTRYITPCTLYSLQIHLSYLAHYLLPCSSV